MKRAALLAMLGILSPCAVLAQDQGIAVTVGNIPANANQVIAVFDGSSTYRMAQSITPGTTTTTVVAGLPQTDLSLAGYRVRVIATAGSGTFPSVVGGGNALGVPVGVGQLTSVNVGLTVPTLTPDPANPVAIRPGFPVTFRWTIHDPAQFLDGNTGMRMWSSAGTAPRSNFLGVQRWGSLINQVGDDYSYSISFNASSTATTMYYQFGEAGYPFEDPTGSQAPFLGLPDVNAGSPLLTLTVGGSVDQGIAVTVCNIPANANQVIAVFDGRSTYRVAQSLTPGTTTTTVVAGLPQTDLTLAGYRVRVIATAGSGTFPSVVGGGNALGVPVGVGQLTSVNVGLTVPTLTPDPANPVAIRPGFPVTFRWTIHDPAQFLDGNTGMRMWSSDGTAPWSNFLGVQRSGSLINQVGDDYSYSISFNASSTATTMYYQFGEAGYPFEDPSGSQAPFLVLPDLNVVGSPLLTLTVGGSVPSITSQPSSQTVALGSTASMTVSASGSTPISFQWYVGATGNTATPIASATSASYTTLPLTRTMNYWVRVSNSLGSADSNTATLNATSAVPFGSFDTPANGTTGLAGSVPITGWALDDVQVTRVTICRAAITGEALGADARCNYAAQAYIGDAVFIDGARPDVQGAFPSLPLSSRAGWGYLMLTNFLPNLGDGTFTFNAYAFDADRHVTNLGAKTVTCNNSASVNPFGSIDKPEQGAVVSGIVGNTGWVLSPGTRRADPPGGGSVSVLVDGNLVGFPRLWNARPDLSAAFPVARYSGINTALGIFGLDTTILTDGVHTIAWIVTANTGETSGVGSRFFTVSNGALSLNRVGAAQQTAPTVIASSATLDMSHATAPTPQSLVAEINRAPEDASTVQGRRGFDLDRPLQPYATAGGRIDVQAEELDRVELHLSASAGPQYSGYLCAAGRLMPLPVGSNLDASTGAFTWMPGAGFYGPYDLVFVRWSNGVAVARQDVRITLNAKGSNRVGPQTIIDAPSSGAAVPSPFFLGGWAADLDSTVDTGVATVHVWAYPVDANGNRLDPIFVGPAIYGGARPDVAAVYGDRFGNSGYGIIVNSLPPGTYDMAVFAYSTIVNNFTAAKVVRVTVR